MFIVYNPDTNENTQEKSTIVFKKQALKNKITHKTDVNKNFMEYTANSWDDLDVEKIIKKI